MPTPVQYVKILALLTALSALASSQETAPVTRSGLYEALRLRALDTEQISRYVAQLGVDFVVNDIEADRLKALGADQNLLEAAKTHYRKVEAPVEAPALETRARPESADMLPAPRQTTDPLTRMEVLLAPLVKRGKLDDLQKGVERRGVNFLVDEETERLFLLAGGSRELLALMTLRVRGIEAPNLPPLVVTAAPAAPAAPVAEPAPVKSAPVEVASIPKPVPPVVKPRAEGPKEALVVLARGVEAYRQAVAAMRGRLEAQGYQVIAVEVDPGGDGVKELRGEADAPYRFTVAVGVEAVRAVSAAGVKSPVVSTMVFLSDLSSRAFKLPKNLAATVYLDSGVRAVAAELQKTFPGKNVYGVLTDKESGIAVDTSTEGELKALGLTVRGAEMRGREDVVKTFLTLRGKVDMVICPPDSRLFDTRTLAALLRASLENNLPLVGFSDAMVQAGAVAGVYPDYEEIGRETAEVALRLASDQPGGDQKVRKLSVAVNKKTLRMLGMSAAQR